MDITSKGEAVRQREVLLNERAAKIIQLIETHISKGETYISLGKPELPEDTDLSVLNHVADKYRDAGWTVSAADDQRDGPYITLR